MKVVKNSKTDVCYKENWKKIICLGEHQQNEISLTFMKEKSVLGEHGNIVKHRNSLQSSVLAVSVNRLAGVQGLGLDNFLTFTTCTSMIQSQFVS